MRLAVIGSREFPLRGLEKLPNTLLGHWRDPRDPLVILSGGARGVDLAAERIGHSWGLEVWSFRPVPTVWDGKGSGRGYRTLVVQPDGSQTYDLPLGVGVKDNPTFVTYRDCAMFRNSLLVRGSDKVLAFWDGFSTGTKDGIEKALGIRDVGCVSIRRNLEVVLP